MRFEWDPDKAAANEAKHGVAFTEAQEVFADDFAVMFDDSAHAVEEPRFRLIGASPVRLLCVIFTLREDASGTEIIRLISARAATTREQRQYHEN
ncbi:MAG: BrnT family toxin [Blastocatellia bacterium]